MYTSPSDDMALRSHIPTRLLILSDTHGESLHQQINTSVDVAIHCGDITDESKLEEFRTAVQLLKGNDAPLKLVIAGNHDFTLDESTFAARLPETKRVIDDDLLLDKIYGDVGVARAILEAEDAKNAGIVLLEEGTHDFTLENGAKLRVYASSYTPSKSTGWGFQYDPDVQEHEWKMDVPDVVITHGPSRGILDYTSSKNRAGSPSLFSAIAKAKPLLHCFGHIHESWGSKLVTWQEELSAEPSHFTDINNDESHLIESQSTLRNGKFDSQKDIDQKEERRQKFSAQGYRDVLDQDIRRGAQTLFVNAAIEGVEEGEQHLPWVVELQLPRQEEGRVKQQLASSRKQKRSAGEADEEMGAAKRRCP